MIVELRAVPGCPNLPGARDLLRVCLAELGLPLAFTERLGDYPSPSVLVNGEDVTGAGADDPAACRLNLPTAESIRTALRRAMGPPAELGIAGSGADNDRGRAGLGLSASDPGKPDRPSMTGPTGMGRDQPRR